MELSDPQALLMDGRAPRGFILHGHSLACQQPQAVTFQVVLKCFPGQKAFTGQL